MNVPVELTMPYYLMMKEFHGEEYNPNPQEVEPQHPDRTMQWSSTSSSCRATAACST